MGRRRVEIKRIEDKARRQTTFTKRRDGLFKKTGELCNLCGTEAAVITFSNAGNTYAFGNPSVDSVIDRYLAITSSSSAAADGGAADERVKERQDKLEEALARLEVEKKRREEIDKALGMLKVNAPVEDSVVREFEKEVKAMEELLDKLRSEADLEAQKKLEEAVDETLAMLNAQNEASRSGELEQEDEDTDEEMTDNGNESQ